MDRCLKIIIKYFFEILQDVEKTTNKTTDFESHSTKDLPICKEISKKNDINILNFVFGKDTQTENFNHRQAISAKDNFETILQFHIQTSEPTSVEQYEQISAPMSALLPINPASPISLDITCEAVERASNDTSPIRGSPISGINMLLSDEEPFVDSESSWIPESDEETRKKRKWKSTVANSNSESKVKISYEKKYAKKTRCKKIRKIFSSPPKSSSSETESESYTIKITKTNARSNINTEREVRLDGTENTTPINGTIPETTDCESITEHSEELRERNNTQKKNIVRWKRGNKSEWKRVKEQRKKRQCLPYENSKGKTIAPKLPRIPKCSVLFCRNKCTELFSETVRLELCKEYWGINDFRLQKEYLLKRIIVKLVARPIKNLPPEKQRSSSREFGFYKDNKLLKVCKNFFTSTLCISNRPIETAIKNINENGSFQGSDSRGKTKPANKTSEDKVNEVKEHIESFPKKDSHYCRKDTTRQYLSENLSISKMYELYETKMKSENKTPVKLNVYKKIFGTEYNLAFYHPKKDQCCLCNRYHRTANPDDALKEEYDDHMKRKEASFVSKDIDKQRSESDETFLCITMDLQSLLQVPSTSDSLMYYCRKLNLYNLSIYEFKPPENNAHCIIWTELNGKRGSIEIASAINSWIKSIPEKVTEVTIYSDTCSGQNRNQYMAAFLLYLVQVSPSLLVIEQKYLESGHTFMEVDSMHSAIEREKRFFDVFCD